MCCTIPIDLKGVLHYHVCVILLPLLTVHSTESGTRRLLFEYKTNMAKNYWYTFIVGLQYQLFSSQVLWMY